MVKTFTFIRFLALLLVLLVCQFVSAQTLKEFFNSSEVPLTYLGIDFTRTKVLNEMVPALDWKEKHFPSMNQVVVNDTSKFDFRKAFTKSNIIYNTKTALARIESINAEKITGESGTDEVKLSKADIDGIAGAYKDAGKKGIGLLFIVENIDKKKVEESLHVALIDLSTGKVLITERFTEKPAGFGIRNYWVKPVRNVVENIQKSRYKKWKENAG
ncbi:MAG: hypothetical protein KF862_06790 [Chitinophagaceae bacterium]|nr:hypothetical protein [Chitinophagaceae bacterium]